jgi:hypothetical protein
MRRFSSYGPLDKEVHYYAPREELIEFAYNQLMGDNPRKGGHYITVWAPRQTGKTWIKKNQEIFFKNVPRRKTDMKIYEAIFHFNLYRYLYDLLSGREVEVVPQFPTGNGKIDLILKYRGKIYAMELKSFKDMYTFERGIDQAAEYGRQLGLKEIVFLVFVELTQEEAKPLEQEVDRSGIKVVVLPVGII